MSKDVVGAAGPETLYVYYRVEVHDHDGNIVTIEPSMLAGRDIRPREERAIRECIRQLSGFIGPERSGGTDAPPPAPPLRKVGVNEANADDRGVAALPSQSLVCSDAVSGEARRGSEDRERRELPARVGQARRHRANASDSQAALVEIWRADADEIEKDGYFCCAQTRRHDAEDLAATLTDAPSRGDRAEGSARVPHAMTAQGREA